MKNSQPKRHQSAVLFQYPALPKYEIRFYVLLIVSLITYAYYCVVKLTAAYEQLLIQRNWPMVKTNLPFFGPKFKDESNWEWNRWSPFALSMVPYIMGHCLVFNIGELFFAQSLMPFISTAYALAVCTRLFSPWLVCVSLLQGIFIFILTHIFRSRIVVWLSSIPILFGVIHDLFGFTDDSFHVLTLVTYMLLSYISFNLEAADGNLRPEDDTIFKKYTRMMFYASYLPYVISLVVIYPDFERQIEERKSRKRHWVETIFFSVRIAFYWLAVELLLHLMWFGLMLHDEIFSRSLPDNEFLMLVMAFGQFFHLKYVVIFGVPAIFAKLDNMQPPKGPVCMATVALYSKTWRCFDRGLYSFFKQYIFIPICAPSFSIPRKIFAVLMCYGFVIVWHGFARHNFIWIALSICELFMEYLGKGIYSIESVRLWREKHIGDVAFRRVVAACQTLTLIPSFYGNMYFVCGPSIGSEIFQRIFIEETLTFNYPVLVLLFSGYVYVQVVLEVDRYKAKYEEPQSDIKIKKRD